MRWGQGGGDGELSLGIKENLSRSGRSPRLQDPSGFCPKAHFLYVIYFIMYYLT